MKRGALVTSLFVLGAWQSRAQAQTGPGAHPVESPAPSQTADSPAFSTTRGAAAALPPRGPSALSQYRQQELSTRFRFWEGQELLRGGAPVEFGYFGGNGETLFAASPTALDDIHRFRTMRITGTALYVVGLSLLVTELVLISSRSPLIVQEKTEAEAAHPKPLFWALLLPGTAASLTGGILMQSANSYLSDAVEHHNADLARRLDQQSRAPRGLFLRYQGAF